MIRAVVLDAGPLGMVTHRGGVPEVDACKRWLLALAERGVRIAIPEIVATTNVHHLSRLVDAKLWREVVVGDD